jgi:hypothetical protein
LHTCTFAHKHASPSPRHTPLPFLLSHHQALSAEAKAAAAQAYVNPAFKLDEAEHTQLLGNASQVDARLKDSSAPLTMEVEDLVVAEDA